MERRKKRKEHRMQEQNHKAPWGTENFKKGENSRQHTIAPTSNCKILKEEL